MKQDRDSQLREASPKGARVFDAVLIDGMRKKHPWLPAWSGELEVLKEMRDDRDAQHIYETLYLRFQHAEFDKMCQSISEEEGYSFDAWGPLHLPSYLKFYRSLSEPEQNGFSNYLALRRRRTIEIETIYRHHNLTYPHFQNLILTATDNRQKFRFLSCVAEHPEEFLYTASDAFRGQFNEHDYAEVVELYKVEKQRYSGTSALKDSFFFTSSVPPIEWLGKKADLIAIIDALKSAKLIDVADKDVAYHFDFKSKYSSQNPTKRISGTRTDMKNHLDNPTPKSIEKVIKFLEQYLPY